MDGFHSSDRGAISLGRTLRGRGTLLLPWPCPSLSPLPSRGASIRRSTSRLAPLAEAFHARAGHAPEGVWFAPGRVNLIGEHTDYSDGFVLPVAIDRGVLVAAAGRADGRLRCWSAQETERLDAGLAELGPGKVESWAAYPAGVAWALGQAGLAGDGGADLLVDGHVPVAVIRKLLADRPAIAGITLPGMPTGSPGMSGTKTEPFVIYAVPRDQGAPTVYVTE